MRIRLKSNYFSVHLLMTNLFLFNLFMAPLFFVVSFIIADIVSSVNSFWQILSKGSETSRQFVRNVNIHSLLSAKSLVFRTRLLCNFPLKRQKEPKTMVSQPQSSAPISPSSNPIIRWLYSFSLRKQPAFHRCAVLPRHYCPYL